MEIVETRGTHKVLKTDGIICLVLLKCYIYKCKKGERQIPTNDFNSRLGRDT